MNAHERLIPGRSLPAVIPAAGLSRRMGQPKLLLPLGGQTVLARLLEALAAAGFGPRIVVVRASDTVLQQVARDCGATVVCPPTDPPDMRSSVEHALDALEQAGPPQPGDGWALVPADHPVLDRQALRQMAGFWPQTTADVLLPVYQSQRGHPTVFRWSQVPAIRALPPDRGLNALLHREETRIEELPVDSPGILTDLDTPDDYRRLRQELEQSRSHQPAARAGRVCGRIHRSGSRQAGEIPVPAVSAPLNSQLPLGAPRPLCDTRSSAWFRDCSLQPSAGRLHSGHSPGHRSSSPQEFPMLRATACSGLAALLLPLVLLSSVGCSPLETTNEMLRQTYKRLSHMNGGPQETADLADTEWDQFGVEARKGQPVVKENDPLSWMKSERHRAIERSLGVQEQAAVHAGSRPACRGDAAAGSG